MPRIEKISINYCNKCKYEFVENASECPNCHGNSLSIKNIFKRLRIERIYFMILAAVFISILTTIIAYFTINEFKPEYLLSGIGVFSLYYAAKYFLGLEFYDYYSEEDSKKKDYKVFSWSYFFTEFIYFFIILICVVIVVIIIHLFK